MPLEAIYDEPFSWGNFFLPRRLYQMKMRKQAQLGGQTPEEGKEQREWLKLGSQLLEKGTVREEDLNALFEETFGMPGIFTTPKLGETVTRVPQMTRGPAGDVGTKQVRTGGVEVTPEAKRKVNLADWMAKRKNIAQMTPEMMREFLTGMGEEKPSVFEQQWEKLQQIPHTTEETKQFLGALTKKPIAKAPQTRTIRRGKYFITEEYQPETQTWKQIGKSKISQSQAGKAGYTMSQQIDDCRAFYKTELSNLVREFGYEHQGMLFIKPENMDLYKARRDRIMADFIDDLQKIDQGQKPKYLTEQKPMQLPEAPKWKYVPGKGMIRIE